MTRRIKLTVLAATLLAALLVPAAAMAGSWEGLCATNGDQTIPHMHCYWYWAQSSNNAGCWVDTTIKVFAANNQNKSATNNKFGIVQATWPAGGDEWTTSTGTTVPYNSIKIKSNTWKVYNPPRTDFGQGAAFEWYKIGVGMPTKLGTVKSKGSTTYWCYLPSGHVTWITLLSPYR